jgi:hypothetical protein
MGRPLAQFLKGEGVLLASFPSSTHLVKIVCRTQDGLVLGIRQLVALPEGTRLLLLVQLRGWRWPRRRANLHWGRWTRRGRHLLAHDEPVVDDGLARGTHLALVDLERGWEED